MLFPRRSHDHHTRTVPTIANHFARAKLSVGKFQTRGLRCISIEMFTWLRMKMVSGAIYMNLVLLPNEFMLFNMCGERVLTRGKKGIKSALEEQH